MWEEGVRIYDTPGVPNNFPALIGLNFLKNHFQIEENIIFFFKKRTSQLMRRNVRAAALNATLQLLVIYMKYALDKKHFA